MKPILIPFDDSSIAVFGHPARATSVPKAGSKTFARSQGNVHWLLRYLNWVSPKSRSWFYSPNPSALIVVVIRIVAKEPHSDTRHLRRQLVQDRNHVRSLRDRALQAWIVRISRKKRYKLRLILVLRPRAVLISQVLESWKASDRLCRTGPMKSVSTGCVQDNFLHTQCGKHH